MMGRTLASLREWSAHIRRQQDSAPPVIYTLYPARMIHLGGVHMQTNVRPAGVLPGIRYGPRSRGDMNWVNARDNSVMQEYHDNSFRCTIRFDGMRGL